MIHPKLISVLVNYSMFETGGVLFAHITKIMVDYRFSREQANGISNDFDNFLEFFKSKQWDICGIHYEQNRSTLQKKDSKYYLNFAHLLADTAFGLKKKAIDNSVDILFAPQLTLNLFKLNSKQKRIVRIHDIFPISNPNWFTFRSRLLFKVALRQLDPKRDILIANSKYTECQLTKLLPEFLNKTFLVPCEIEVTYSKACESCRGCEYLKNTNLGYALMVGTIEPRKNYRHAIESWRITSNRKFEHLVIVGQKGWKQDQAVYNLLNATNDGVHYLGWVCDAALESLLSNCNLFVSTSHDEGFNIPLHRAATKSKAIAVLGAPYIEYLSIGGLQIVYNSPGKSTSRIFESDPDLKSSLMLSPSFDQAVDKVFNEILF